MGTGDKFPWELLKAECLRLVCAQLIEASGEGQNALKLGRKEEMIAFLNNVYERGVSEALQDVDLSKKINTSIQQATPSKRKTPLDGDEDAEGDSDNDENEEGYNTRYKGIKRVKVHGPTPEPPGLRPRRRLSRPRKSVPVEGEVRKRGRPRKNVSSAGEAIKVSKGKGRPLENGETVEDVVVVSSISRPRGRPRKNENGVPRRGPVKKPRRQSTNANHVPLSKDSGREVFDGILLVKRQNGKERVVGDGQEDDNAGDNDGEVPPAGNNDEGNGSEEDAVLAAVNGDDAQGDLSSLGGSNKENEISATYTPDPEEGHHETDLDADGEFEADADAEV